MSDSAAIITTAISTLGLILIAAITHYVQLIISRRQGVKSRDVQVQPAAPTPDPNEGWREYVLGLRERAERAERRLAAEQSLRWAAIHYARRLLDVITQKFPGADLPPVPDDLSSYIVIPGKDTTS